MQTEIDELVQEIYKTISSKIASKKNALQLPASAITENKKLLYNVIKNKIVPGRNTYLLIPSLTLDIVKNLHFSSEYDLIWTDQDFYKLFTIGIKFLETQKQYSDLIEYCLMDFFPYANLEAQYEINIEPKKPDTDEVAFAESEAIHRLYLLNENHFLVIHKAFFKEKGTSKLNKNLILFFTACLPNLLQQFLKENDFLGKKTFDLISLILKYEKESDVESLIYSSEWQAHQPIAPNGRPISEIRQEVIDSGKNYINTIVNAQEEEEKNLFN